MSRKTKRSLGSILWQIAAVLIILFAGAEASAAQIHSLFSDHRAMRVGDILTIIIVESAKAGSESKTNTSKGFEAGFGTRATRSLPLPSNDIAIGASSNYDGKGATSRSGSLNATVTARVTEVLESGNLVIEGSKTVEINQEREIIKISGIVRPQDIQKNNVLFSTSIADAEIQYSGNGAVNTAARPGFIARFVNWLF